MNVEQPIPPQPPCPYDPPCWWCSNPDKWAVIDGEIVRLDDEEPPA